MSFAELWQFLTSNDQRSRLFNRPEFWSSGEQVARILPISEVKTRLPELVTGVERREEEVIVTRKGKPVAVVVNYAEYERLKETLDVLADPELMRQIARSKGFFARGGKGLSFEDVFGEPLRLPKKRKRR